MKTLCPGVLLAFSLAIAPVIAPAAEPSLATLTNLTVGDWTDSRRLEFSGVKTFTADQLRSALLRDVPFLLASHPQAPRDRFLPTLEQRLSDGFQCAGFPDARVRATLDGTARRVRVQISEGPRLYSGDVLIRGAVTVPAAHLVRRLTEEWNPAKLIPSPTTGGSIYLNSAGDRVEKEEPLWQRGKPAAFDEASLDAIARRLTNVLAQAGCFFAKAQPRLVLRPGTNVADLQVDLEEGPSARIGRLQVLGVKRNTPESILNWLGLRSGQFVTNDLIGRIERQLWDSGRFLLYRVAPGPVPGRPELVDLDLWLEELPAAPPIGHALTSEEQVALKFRDWILALPESRQDIVAAVDWGPAIGDLEFVVSGEGVIAVHRQGGALRYAAVVGRGRASLYSFTRQRRLDFTGDNTQLCVFLSILPTAENESGNRFNITLYAGFNSRRDLQPGDLQLNLALAPVAFLHLTHPTNQTVRLEAGALRIHDEDMSLALDAATGRLMELRGTDKSADTRARARGERGAFDRMWRELESASAAFPKPPPAHLAFSGKLAGAATELFDWMLQSTNRFQPLTPAQRLRAADAFEKVGIQALAFLDPLVRALIPGTNAFIIPTLPPRLGQSAQLAGMANLAAWVFEYADQLLPARSWPWTVSREMVFALGGQGRYTDSELQAIYTADESGPLAFLSCALLLSRVDPHLAQAFATRGLERLSSAHFQKDYRLFLDPQFPVGRIFQKAAGALRDLPGEDLDALAAGLSRRHAVFLRLVITRLKAAPERPLAETLGPLLEDLWNSDLRPAAEASLREITGHAVAATERQRLYDEAVKADELGLHAEAFRKFRQAADLGLPDAQYVLAQYLEKGLGQPRDEDAASHWYHVAASNGVTSAQMLLGARHSLGLDGPDDAVQAYFWYSLAAASGDRAAEAFRNSTRRRLTPAQLQEAESRLAQSIVVKPKLGR